MQLEPLVRRVLAPNPSPYTYTGTQTYIVGMGDGCAVIDPGPDEEAHLLAVHEHLGPVLAFCLLNELNRLPPHNPH